MEDSGGKGPQISDTPGLLIALLLLLLLFYYAEMAATHIHEYTNTSTKSKKLEKR